MPRDSGRNAQTIRQLQIIAFLDSMRYGATLDELAEEFGVETRTIRRDLDAIKALGYEVIRLAREGAARYKLDNPLGKRIPAANLTSDELTALLLAHDWRAPTCPTVRSSSRRCTRSSRPCRRPSAPSC